MSDEASIAASTPITDIVGMKNWNDAKRRWDGVICQAVRGDDGKDAIVVYDVVCADTQVEVDDLIRDSLATKPWLAAKD